MPDTFDLANSDRFLNTTGESGSQIRARREQTITNVPYELLERYLKIAETGIYGKEGLDKIRKAMAAQRALRLKQLTKGLKPSLGRRLGARSGALSGEIMNRVIAPSLGEEQGALAGLEAENYRSRLSGISGAGNVTDFMNRQFQFDKEQKRLSDASGGGFLDTVLGLGTAAADIFTGGAASATKAGIGAVSGGVTTPPQPAGLLPDEGVRF